MSLDCTMNDKFSAKSCQLGTFEIAKWAGQAVNIEAAGAVAVPGTVAPGGKYQ